MVFIKRKISLGQIIFIATLAPLVLISVVTFLLYQEFKTEQQKINANNYNVYFLTSELEKLRLEIRRTNNSIDLANLRNHFIEIREKSLSNEDRFRDLDDYFTSELISNISLIRDEMISFDKYNLEKTTFEIENDKLMTSLQNSLDSLKKINELNFVHSRNLIKTLTVKFILFSFIVLIISMCIVYVRVKTIVKEFKELYEIFLHSGDALVDENSFNQKFDIQELEEVLHYLVKNSNELFYKRKELDEKNKLAMVGEVTAHIMHEIATPITVLKGNANKLLKSDSEEMIKMGQLNLKMVDRVMKIINTIKKGIHRSDEKNEFQLILLRDLLDEVKILVSARLVERKVELKIDDVEEIEIECYEGQMIQVLVNLIHNAADAISYLDEKWIKVSLQKESSNVKIQIIDSGKGITPEVEQKLFTPFYTTKGVGKGTGVGLTLSRKIIEEHKGELNYLSGNENTIFEIKLPLKNREKG